MNPDRTSDARLIAIGLLIAGVVLAVATLAGTRPAPSVIPADTVKPSLGTFASSPPDASSWNLSARTSSPLAAPVGRVGHALMGGRVGYAEQSLGSHYLAMRLPRGTLVRICGPAACINRATTDYGPSSRIRPPRMADLSWWDWATVCGLSHSAGLCVAQATIHERIALPPTDTE